VPASKNNKLSVPEHLSPSDKPLQKDYPVVDPKRFPGKLSNLAKAIYRNVTESMIKEGAYDNSPTPLDLIGTAGKMKELVYGHGNTDRFGRKVIIPAIVGAEEEVLITTFMFVKNTPTAEAVGEAIVELNKKAAKRGKKIRVYLTIDSFGASVFGGDAPSFSSLFSSVSNIDGKHYNLPEAKDVPYLDYRVKNVHTRLLGTLHSKMILVDGHHAVLGSKNLDGDAAFEWMFTLEGAVTRSMRSDFENIWNEKLPSLPSKTFYGPRPGVDVPVVVLSRVQSNNLLSTRFRNPQNYGWLSALANARRKVYIQTPNFTVEVVAKAVLDAVRRGIAVTIVTSYDLSSSSQKIYKYNVSDDKGTAKWMFEQLKNDPKAAARLRICWFVSADRKEANPQPTAEDYSHVKFMNVDDEISIAGSGNMDAQTVYRSREDNVLIDSASITRKMTDALLANHNAFKHCYRP